MPPDPQRASKKRPSLTRTEVTVIWSTTNIKRLLRLIKNNREYRIRFFPKGLVKLKLCDVARDLCIDLLKGEREYMEMLHGRGQVVRDTNGIWTPTANWNSTVNNPVVTKFHDLKKRYEAAQETFHIKEKWKALHHLPEGIRDDLRKTCPWYFEFRELDEMTDDEPAPITAPTPAPPPQPPASVAKDLPTSASVSEGSSSSAKVTKKSIKASKAGREAAVSQEASSSKRKGVVSKSEVIYIDDTSSEAEPGPDDDIHMYSEHEMENDIVEITDALGSGHASADTEAAGDDGGGPRRQSSGVKREREETPLLGLMTKKKGRRSDSELDSEADEGSSNDDTTLTRSGEKSKSAHLVPGQASTGTPPTPHSQDGGPGHTGKNNGLPVKVATEVGDGKHIVKEDCVESVHNPTRRADLLRQLGTATRPHKPKNEGDVPRIFSLRARGLDDYLAASDSESRMAVVHRAQAGSMRNMLHLMQKENLTAHSLNDCAIGLWGCADFRGNKSIRKGVGQRARDAGAIRCGTTQELANTCRPIRIRVRSDLLGFDELDDIWKTPDDQDDSKPVAIRQMSFLTFGRFWYKRLKTNGHVTSS